MPASATTSVRQPPSSRVIAWWLVACAAMIFIMVVLGGATRLTESGLSMVEWKPLHVVPPLNEAQWQDEFSAYQTSPEYRLKNTGMSLGDFKKIYWFEFTHRLWGRLIGAVFAVPFLWFIWRGAVDRPLFYKLGGLFILGGAQGALGWFMVASGLVDRPDVSQYRLAAHLCLAFTVYGLIVWVALDLFGKDAPPSTRLDPPTRRLAAILPFFALFVIGAGAFVAGINAGLIYNTFPLMDGQVIPEAVYSMDPWYLSAFEDATTVQFNHRMVAITLVALVAIAWWRARNAAAGRTRTVLNALTVMTLIQASLGISTLVQQVPLGLALAHQAGALVLFTLTIWFAHTQRRPRAEPARAAPSLHVEPAE